MTQLIKLRNAVVMAAIVFPSLLNGQGRYVTGDFHQHTTYFR